MNASENGLHRNVEMMIKLTAFRYYLNLDNAESDLFGPDEKGNPFEEVDLSNYDGIAPDESEKDNLELIIKDICRINAKAVINPTGDKYDVLITFPTPKGGLPMAEISPAKTARTQQLAEKMVFEGLSALELTELYRVTVKGKTESITRMILIPTEMPSERDDMVVKSILKDKKAFVDYLAFILGDDYVSSAMEIKASLGADKENGQNSLDDSMPAIYEKMLKTAYTEPERLKEIRNVMERISDSDIIPDEFVKLYETFAKTLKLK